MKKTFLLLATATVLLAACNSGGSVAEKQRIIDSLVKLVPPAPNAPNAPGAKTMSAFSQTGQKFQEYPISNYYVPQNEASVLIQNMHAIFKGKSGATLPMIDTAFTSFVVPANTLKKIIDTSNSPFAIFYIGFDKSSGQLRLIYTGITQVPGTDSFTEVTFQDPNIPTSSMVFDNGIPCPTCLGIGIHSQMGQMTSVITNWGATNGTIAPAAGVLQVKYGSDQTFTYKSSPGYAFKQVVIDNVADTKDSFSYTFKKVQEAHTISVEYVPVTGK